jgi:hypothetical protein
MFEVHLTMKKIILASILLGMDMLCSCMCSQEGRWETGVGRSSSVYPVRMGAWTIRMLTHRNIEQKSDNQWNIFLIVTLNVFKLSASIGLVSWCQVFG